MSELGVKTMRDGSISLSETDFKKAFEQEPILFDIVVNSMATSDNPLVVASQTSSVLIPKAGSYSFVTGADGASSTLGGVDLSEATLADGSKQYTAVSGDAKGLRLQVNGSVSSATVFYGQSLADKLSEFVKDVISSTGVLEKSKSRASSLISEYNENKADLDTKITSMRDRYMQQFSAMEAAVSGFNKTGEFLTGFIDSMKPKD